MGRPSNHTDTSFIVAIKNGPVRSKYDNASSKFAAWAYGLACPAAPLLPHEDTTVKDPNLSEAMSTFLASRISQDVPQCVWISLPNLLTSCMSCVFSVGTHVLMAILRFHAAVFHGQCHKCAFLLFYLLSKRYALITVNSVPH